MDETPIIRCMGLNYRDHAREANMPIPDVPVLFIKPRTALNGPFPAKIPIPAISQDGTSDYEAELSFIISKTGRDIPEEEALDYVLGYTASNDVSARTQQFKNSQWCFSKGWSCKSVKSSHYVRLIASLQVLMDLVLLDQFWSPPPLLVTRIPSKLRLSTTEKQFRTQIRGSFLVFNTCASIDMLICNFVIREMIFTVPQIISFLSRGTTLERGTIVMTGTGPGIGAMRNPKVVLNHGDDIRVEVEKIGTLINEVFYE